MTTGNMTAGPLFPIAVKDASLPALDGAGRYVVARNGLFLERNTPLFSAGVPLDGEIPGLAAHQPWLTLRLPRLPEVLLEQAMGFFRSVYRMWRGEAILIIFYAPPLDDRAGRYALVAPPQLLHGRRHSGRFWADLRLDYGACKSPGAGFIRLGSFHSHAEVGPAHSGVDAHDELYEAGLHLTAGYVDSRFPEFAAAFVVGRTRFQVSVESVLPCFRSPRPAPAAWLAQVTIACDRACLARPIAGARRGSSGRV